MDSALPLIATVINLIKRPMRAARLLKKNIKSREIDGADQLLQHTADRMRWSHPTSEHRRDGSRSLVDSRRSRAGDGQGQVGDGEHSGSWLVDSGRSAAEDGRGGAGHGGTLAGVRGTRAGDKEARAEAGRARPDVRPSGPEAVAVGEGQGGHLPTDPQAQRQNRTVGTR
ncbi:hypothetical protein BRADI_1g24765v3 [Brachypodium distachyon]|uniref:Uncharacterized protein n=1 Tax=Brachypodium distachyon TaxID=15368 RepID=A0A2K2DKZ8_BRADI|nr:hypothetical protein BRADI_1g24765v3 [Brachypodium distachyon]